MVRRRFAWAASLRYLRWMVAGSAAAMAQECKNRGQLDTLYCDENNDLVADVPTDPKKLKDPATLVFAYTPVEDPAVYQNVFKPFTDFLAQCTGKRVSLLPGAVELGRDRGDALGPPARRRLLDRADRIRRQHGGRRAVRRQGHREGTARLPSDLDRARRTAPTRSSPISRASASRTLRRRRTPGHLAPLVLYPPEGLKPNEDYKPLMSGGHDKSALGVVSGDYDMAGVASDVFERMVTRGTLKADDFRIIFTSPMFPTSSFAYAHDLHPDLVQEDQSLLLRLRLPAVDAEGVQRRRPLLPDHLQGHLEGGARDRRRLRHALQQGGLRGGSKARGRGAGKEAASSSRRRSSRRVEGTRAMDVSTSAHARGATPASTARSSSATCARSIAPASRCSRTSRSPSKAAA